MRILLITVSARGHAIAQALARSRHAPSIISVSPKRNPGIARLADEVHEADPTDTGAVTEIARRSKPDFAIVAPDDPIGAGIVDALEAEEVPCVAPTQALARIETSKGFTRDLLARYEIDASPRFQVFTEDNEQNLNTYIEQELRGNYVVKYDGLRGGKGVKVSGEHLATTDEGVAYAQECIAESGQVVVEEKLTGAEFSLMSFVSGTQVVDMPAVQDHKRAYEGDTGPNTGGMGTYSDADHRLPFLDASDIERASEINRRTAAALQEEWGADYRGILYGGFIGVADGIRLIEYNARFGDPEALNVLPLLSSDFTDICLGMINGNLSNVPVTFEQKATVCLYVTPDCYPDSKERRGEPVSFPQATENVRIYFGDITEDSDGTLRLGGSRTAGIVGIGDTLEEARQAALQLCKQVEGPVRFRRDIGTNELIGKRKELMQKLREV